MRIIMKIIFDFGMVLKLKVVKRIMESVGMVN